jgi:predicted nucleotidyltransferase
MRFETESGISATGRREDNPGRGCGYSRFMAVLAEASLNAAERRVLDRLVAGLAAEFGPRLRSIWLYGSRARGETTHSESDVDVLVVVDPELPDDSRRVVGHAVASESAEGPAPVFVSTLVYGTERLAQRREIESFFIQEVDRDKIVLFGDP